MISRNQRHNFTPGITSDYMLPASMSYTSSLFETACRNTCQWRWPAVLEAILTYLPPPRPTRTGYFRLYGRSVSQIISSLSVSSNCDKILLITQNTMHTVLQCLPFIVTCLKSSLWKIHESHEVLLLARVGKGLAVFVYCFQTSILIGSPVCFSWSDTIALYPMFLPLW